MTNAPPSAPNTTNRVRLTSISARYLTRFVPIIMIIFTVMISLYGTVAYHQAMANLATKLDTLVARQSLLLGEAVADGRNDRI
ncbi:MAG: hypothetical protein RLN70_10585, partial [Rhodospirillaceae bacterium]